MSCLRENLTISSYGEGLETGRVRRVPRQFLTRQEAFKRIKHRLSLEHVSGLSQHAVLQDLAAKVLCDNLQALVTLSAHARHDLPPERRINRAYVHSVIKPLLPSLLLGVAAATSLAHALALIARHTFRHRPGLSKPRKPRPKPHKFMTQKAC